MTARNLYLGKYPAPILGDGPTVQPKNQHCLGTNKEEGFLTVQVFKVEEPIHRDSFRSFCVTAYYPGEPENIIESRKIVGSIIKDRWVCDKICLPYNSRQQLLMLDIFEVDKTGRTEVVGRATLPLADPQVHSQSEWPLVRGDDFAGMVTVMLKFPGEEDVKVKQPTLDTVGFPDPNSPRQFTLKRSTKTKQTQGVAMSQHVEGADMRVFDIPREGVARSNKGQGQVEMRRTGSKGSSEGSSPTRDMWMPLTGSVAGSCFGLDPPNLDVAGIMAGKGHTPLPNPWKPMKGPLDASRLVLKPPVLDVLGILEGKVHPVAGTGFGGQPVAVGPRVSSHVPHMVPVPTVAMPAASRVAAPAATWIYRTVFVAPPRYVA